MTILNRCALVLLILCGAAGSSARADERILAFDSRIQVQADGSMDVTETIRVRSEGDKIKHGIYRDFPTDYRDRGNNAVRVVFEPRSLTRDGATEPFHSERQSNGVRVYFGSKDTTLAPGEHSYAFTYHTNRQLGFFADHDELYWNVTGNGWDFPIDEASAEVELPGAIPTSSLRLDGYTGPQGAQGRDYSASADAPSHARFVLTEPLMPREGLTIVVGFPKGIVTAPSQQQRIIWFLGDNASVLALIAGLLLILAWYLVQWTRVGRDPKPGVIIPLYAAPTGFTPSALRYVERMGWDDRCAAADLVDAAVRGAISINEDDSKFRIARLGQAELPAREKTLVDELLRDESAFTFERSEHKRIAAAIKTHREGLERDYAEGYFRKNTALVVIGALLTLATLLGIVLLSQDRGRAIGIGFIVVWLSGWSFGVFGLCAALIGAWGQVRRGSLGKRAGAAIGALGITLFAAPFLVGEIVGLGMLVFLAGIALSIGIIALVATNVLFAWLMKAPTQTGRKLLDQVDGLRLYLGVAERDELAAQKAPPMTAAEYQRMLPYALALDVEQNWTNQFTVAVGAAAAAAAVAAASWYRGGALDNLGSFGNNIGASFSSAISSSSSAPGSSSGGGGGGSSGGGGGGGGGGGW